MVLPDTSVACLPSDPNFFFLLLFRSMCWVLGLVLETVVNKTKTALPSWSLKSSWGDG